MGWGEGAGGAGAGAVRASAGIRAPDILCRISNYRRPISVPLPLGCLS